MQEMQDYSFSDSQTQIRENSYLEQEKEVYEDFQRRKMEVRLRLTQETYFKLSERDTKNIRFLDDLQEDIFKSMIAIDPTCMRQLIGSDQSPECFRSGLKALSLLNHHPATDHLDNWKAFQQALQGIELEFFGQVYDFQQNAIKGLYDRKTIINAQTQLLSYLLAEGKVTQRLNQKQTLQVQNIVQLAQNILAFAEVFNEITSEKYMWKDAKLKHKSSLPDNYDKLSPHNSLKQIINLHQTPSQQQTPLSSNISRETKSSLSQFSAPKKSVSPLRQKPQLSPLILGSRNSSRKLSLSNDIKLEIDEIHQLFCLTHDKHVNTPTKQQENPTNIFQETTPTKQQENTPPKSRVYSQSFHTPAKTSVHKDRGPSIDEKSQIKASLNLQSSQEKFYSIKDQKPKQSKRINAKTEMRSMFLEQKNVHPSKILNQSSKSAKKTEVQKTPPKVPSTKKVLTEAAKPNYSLKVKNQILGRKSQIWGHVQKLNNIVRGK